MTTGCVPDGEDPRTFDTGILRGASLDLEPLCVEHADEMALLLDDTSLHEFIAGHPLDALELRARYARQVKGRSPDGRQRWLNWIVRLRRSGAVVGYVQATVSGPPGSQGAELAWVIGSQHQGNGYAQQAVQVVRDVLSTRGVRTVQAHIHPGHHASNAVARHAGLSPIGKVVAGEARWERRLPPTAEPR